MQRFKYGISGNMANLMYTPMPCKLKLLYRKFNNILLKQNKFKVFIIYKRRHDAK